MKRIVLGISLLLMLVQNCFSYIDNKCDKVVSNYPSTSECIYMLKSFRNKKIVLL